jgi:peroxiredoxin Q/BCP
MLKAGDLAPDFTVKDVDGHSVKLSKFSQKRILIGFMRYSGCPFCNLALHRLTVEAPLLKQNDCDIITFIQSTPDNISKNIYGRHAVRPPFPIIADPEMKQYKKYDVHENKMAYIKSISKIPYWVHSVRAHGFKQTDIDGKLFLVPAFFLIDGKTMQIIKADYGSSFYDHDTFTDVYQNLIFKEY